MLGRCHHIVIILIESDKKQKLNNHGLEVSIFCLENYIFSLVSCSVLLGKTRVGLVSHALLYSFFTFYLENINSFRRNFSDELMCSSWAASVLTNSANLLSLFCIHTLEFFGADL